MDLRDLHILVVDDDDLMLHQVKLTLNKMDIHQVQLVSNGRIGLDLLQKGMAVHILFLDLNMPDMDGVEVMRNLARSQFPGAIILFSGEDKRILKTAESLASAHQLHVIGSLTKPVTVHALTEILANYKPRNITKNHRRVELIEVDQLRKAIEDNQIVPYYQPKVDALNKQVLSVEILARWEHPTQGVVPPIAFIPVAEEMGLIEQLTQSILQQGLRQCGRWLRSGHKLSLAINLCADSLCRVDFPEMLAAMAKENQVSCSQIILEITESRLMKNLTMSLDVLTRLRLKGFGLSIDDFGTGYSTMVQLNQIPFTELKIDQAFVHNVADDPAAKAILESSAVLAKKLNMTLVAEGVENLQDWSQAVEVGCDLIQGYFVARPMPLNNFLTWLDTYQQPLTGT